MITLPTHVSPIRALAVSILALAVPFATAQGGDPFAPGFSGPDPDDLVRLSILSDHSTVAPGQEFSLGVRFQIEDGWHLYWKNPGDTGMPPSFEFDLPGSVTLGEARWPAPKAYEQPGGMLDYIHEDELMVIFPATLAEEAPAGEAIEIAIKSVWLVCEEVCLRGEGKASVSLAVEKEPERSMDQSLFDAARRALPRPIPEERWTFKREADTVSIRVPGATSLTFIPDPSTSPALVDRAGESRARGPWLSMRIDPEGVPDSFSGILVAESVGKTEHFVIDPPLDPAEGEPRFQ